MKKRYVLNYDENQFGAVVARDGDETMVQVGEGDMTPVNFRPVLNGKAISIRFGGRLHLIHLSSAGKGGSVQATLGGRPVSLTVMDELRAQALESLGDAAGSGTIAADIPGLVVQIKVTEGQVVHKGEPVIVVEAMKMQNELTAAISGTVSEVPVAEGDSVNPGDPLVVIEPEPGV
ncbi:MAG: biotin/lipoyl-containing protein [Candidatus Krumholzibacteriota bacterium]